MDSEEEQDSPPAGRERRRTFSDRGQSGYESQMLPAQQHSQPDDSKVVVLDVDSEPASPPVAPDWRHIDAPRLSLEDHSSADATAELHPVINLGKANGLARPNQPGARHQVPPNAAATGQQGPSLFRLSSYPPSLEASKAAGSRSSSGTVVQQAKFEELSFLQQIGEGGFGRVYYGYWQGQRVAIKLAHPASGAQGGDMEHLVREFSREVAAMSALPPHKNVLQLLAACTVPPQLALITEYCPAGSLYQLLHSPLPSPTSPSPGLGGSGGGAAPPPSPGSLPHLLGVCLGVAQGMAWLHHHNILHRDLKSANILLDGAGNARIADFGLAKIYSGRQVLTGGLGTYQWAAPEVLAHQRYSEKADVYSFGIVLWECLTRRIPYEGMTAVQAAVGVVNHGLRPEIPRGTAPEVADLVRACWAAVPEQRPSFMQIEVQLAQLLDSTHRQHLHHHHQLLAAAAAAAAASAGYQQHPHAGHYQQQGVHYQPHQQRHQQHHHNHHGRAEAAAVLVDVGAAAAPSPGPTGGPSMIVAVGQ